MQNQVRYLRFKYHITIRELAACSDVSAQRLSRIDLGKEKPSEYLNELVERAFHRLILYRRSELDALEKDFEKYHECLLDDAYEEERL